MINGPIEDPLPLGKPRKKSWLNCNPGVKLRLYNNCSNWQRSTALHLAVRLDCYRLTY